MPDGSKAAEFVLNNFIELFTLKAVNQAENISAFNSALKSTKMDVDQSSQSVNAISPSLCAVCNRDLSKNNSKPVP